jgi:hypothetical protein
MSGQRFIARERFVFSNGAIGWRPGGPFDCLGPYAKVQNCPLWHHAARTAYATGYADTFFLSARCTVAATVRGYFAAAKDGRPDNIAFIRSI